MRVMSLGSVIFMLLLIIVPIIVAVGTIVWKALKDKNERERENMRLFDNIAEGDEDE